MDSFEPLDGPKKRDQSAWSITGEQRWKVAERRNDYHACEVDGLRECCKMLNCCRRDGGAEGVSHYDDAVCWDLGDI